MRNFGKSMPPSGWFGMRQRQEALREQVLLADLRRRRRRRAASQVVPGGQLDAHALLNRLAARHRDARGGAVGEVVALGQQAACRFCTAGFAAFMRWRVVANGSLMSTCM